MKVGQDDNARIEQIERVVISLPLAVHGFMLRYVDSHGLGGFVFLTDDEVDDLIRARRGATI